MESVKKYGGLMMTRYESAKEIYKSFGVDTEEAIKN